MKMHFQLLAYVAMATLAACEQSASGLITSGQGGSGGNASGGSGGTTAKGGSGGSARGGSGGNASGGRAGSGSGGNARGGSGGSALGGVAGSTRGGSGGNAGSGSGGNAGSGSGGSAGAGGGGAGGGSGGKGSGGATGGGGGGVGGSTVGSGGATGTGGAGTGGAASGGSTGSGGSTTCSSASDTCPAPKGGLVWSCKKRFAYGVNYAWSNFAGDFGGIAAWSQKGVAGEKAARTQEMTEMKDNGVDVIRWWMFPDLRGDGIQVDGSKSPSGLGDTVVDDINAALDIAKQLDLHIRLTLFSFDNFFSTRDDSGLTIVGLQPIVIDSTKRAALIKNVVVPIAQAVESSPNKDRMIGWDVINEPEWAISGSDPYGDQAFDPQSQGSGGITMQTVTFAQMESFVKDVVTALHGASSAPVSVGGAAVKWAKAWSQVGLDYYDFHWYGWVDQYYPHTKTPAEYQVDDKQVVVGEFPLNPSSDQSGEAFGGIDYGKLVDDFLAAGYAGTQGWSYSDSTGAFNWSTAKANVKSWAAAHTCYTHF